MSDNVTFQPPGPFGLPAAQSATATALNGSVEVRLRALIDGTPETLVFQIVPNQALALASQLMSAALAANKA